MNRIAVLMVSAWVVVAFATAGAGMAGATSSAASSNPDAIDEAGVGFADENESVENETNASDSDDEPIDAEDNTTDADNETADEGDFEENDTVDADDTNGTAGDGIPPGARLSGVIGIQQAELQGEVESRSFGLSIAAARSNGSKAMIIGNESEQLRERLNRLENATQELNESYQNGTIPEGAYRARLAHLTTKIRMTERLVNQTADSAERLPSETLQAHGVNVTMLHQLRQHARNMTGPEVAAVARQIGGPQVGHPLGKERGPPSDRPGHGPPHRETNETNESDPGQGPPDGQHGNGPPGENGPNNKSTVDDNRQGPRNSSGDDHPRGPMNATDDDDRRGPMNGSSPGDDGDRGNNTSERGPGNGPPGSPAAVEDAIGSVATLLRSMISFGF